MSQLAWAHQKAVAIRPRRRLPEQPRAPSSVSLRPSRARGSLQEAIFGGVEATGQPLTTPYKAKSSLTLYVLEMHGDHQSAIIRLT